MHFYTYDTYNVQVSWIFLSYDLFIKSICSWVFRNLQNLQIHNWSYSTLTPRDIDSRESENVSYDCGIIFLLFWNFRFFLIVISYTHLHVYIYLFSLRAIYVCVTRDMEKRDWLKIRLALSERHANLATRLEAVRGNAHLSAHVSLKIIIPVRTHVQKNAKRKQIGKRFRDVLHRANQQRCSNFGIITNGSQRYLRYRVEWSN